MAALNIWIPCFGDPGQLATALDSTTPWAAAGGDLTVYVVDGRYATFDGDHDLTPLAGEIAARYDHVTYTHPPFLPLGDPDEPDEFRSPQHEQAKWVNYELLPEGEWALEMDTDERLEQLHLNYLDDLNPRRKYTPQVLTPDGEQLLPAIRLYQPQYWTFWIDDVCFWRELYPRDTPLKELCMAHATTAHRNSGYGGETGAMKIRNHGADRPEEYQQRRATQLDRMGVTAAAEAVRDGRQPSTVDDLQEEYGQ